MRQFLLDEFVGRGMIVDYAIHKKDAGEDGIQNPHFHVLCPIRPLNPDGSWGNKQRREYILDEHGNRIPDGKGDYEFKAVPTTDWGSPERLEAWRQAWADLCNSKFEEKGLPERIDHRSFARQGIEQIPTVHEGPAVRQMEARGIATDKGSLNRLIRATNQRLREIARRITELLQGLAAIKEQLNAPQSPVLADLLTQRLEQRNAGAWSNKAKIGNLKEFSELVLILQERGIVTLADFDAYMQNFQKKSAAMTAALNAWSARMKELSELIRFAGEFQRMTPIYEEWNSIRFKKARDKYKNEHEREINLFLLAKRKLDAAAVKLMRISRLILPKNIAAVGDKRRRAVRDHAVAALACGRVDRAGYGVHVASLLKRRTRGDQRAASLRRLDHHGRKAQSADDPVAHREM